MKIAKEFDTDWLPDGFQVKKVRRPRKRVPWWANSDTLLADYIFEGSRRRYKVAYLYWRVGFNAREVAEELEMTQTQVESIICRLHAGQKTDEELT